MAAKIERPASDPVEAVLSGLPERHQQALRWFAERAGHEVGWPQPLADGTLLVCRPKGIYKPRWSGYALSVRESLGRPYPDEEPIFGRDGSWSYRYFQENIDAGEQNAEFTNRALKACVTDSIPVGVLRQVVAKPKPRYRVLGIAFVRRWREGFFELEGLGRSSVTTTDDAGERLYLQGPGAKAEGENTPQGFVVLADSIARSTVTPSIQTYLVELRQRLMEDGILEETSGGFRFTQDHLFKSPSEAAGTTLGRSANGRIEWKNAEGRTLRQIQIATAQEVRASGQMLARGSDSQGDGADILTQEQIGIVVLHHMQRGKWYSLAELYVLIERHASLSPADLEPDAPESNTPKWKRNVRNWLQKYKSEIEGGGLVEWDPVRHTYYRPG